MGSPWLSGPFCSSTWYSKSMGNADLYSCQNFFISTWKRAVTVSNHVNMMPCPSRSPDTILEGCRETNVLYLHGVGWVPCPSLELQAGCKITRVHKVFSEITSPVAPKAAASLCCTYCCMNQSAKSPLQSFLKLSPETVLPPRIVCFLALVQINTPLTRCGSLEV